MSFIQVTVWSIQCIQSAAIMACPFQNMSSTTMRLLVFVSHFITEVGGSIYAIKVSLMDPGKIQNGLGTLLSVLEVRYEEHL